MNATGKLLRIIILLSSLTVFAQKQQLIEDIAIICKGPESRTFTFTNKHYSQLHGETNAYSTNGWHGWICREQKLFIDWKITAGKNELSRAKAVCNVTPDKLTRVYPGGITEQIAMLDSLDAFVLSLQGCQPETFSFSNFQAGEAKSVNDHIIAWNIDHLLPGFVMYVVSDSLTKIAPDIKKNGAFSLRAENKSNSLLFCILPKNQEPLTLANATRNLQQRKQRINRVLEHCRLKTTDADFDKAYLWACASIDALVTTQDVTGIFAGLPWFNNNWGRDTFLSLPGASLVNGFYSDAKAILEAFSAFQDTNSASQYYGRIPNRVTLQDAIYNTTDGTPLCIIQAYSYWKLTGDEAFIQKMYPKIKLAFYAAKEKYVDTLGFLTHKDAETWMDAVGPDGPWSPRGNRANDIQSLWRAQLEVSIELAKKFGDNNLMRDCRSTLQKLKQHFASYYINSKGELADRITIDGKADFSYRPNIFFTLLDTLLIDSKVTRTKILQNSFTKLVTKHGPLSLSFTDKNFHPFHEFAPLYPKDAAYHNGIIWQWNIGPVISVLCQAGGADKAMVLTDDLTKQILTQGAVGTIAELMEAMPRKGEKRNRLSGAFSQAWSLGEYIRNIREDYLGIKTDVIARSVVIAPANTRLLKNVTFPVFYGDTKFSCAIKTNAQNYTVRLLRLTGELEGSYSIELPYANKSIIVRGNLPQDLPLEFTINSGKVEYAITGTQGTSNIITPERLYNSEIRRSLRFAEFGIDSTWTIFQKPSYPLLENSTIKTSEEKTKIIIDATDAEKDEMYSYPSNPQFKPGILDIKRFTLKEDPNNYYFTLTFTALANPQWHPEYGFQLTIAGIYIQGSEENAGINAFKNTQYQFAANRKFNRVVFVGGGIEVWDGDGKILAAYLPKPEDIKNPLGSTENGTITFTLPRSFIGKINSQTKISVLVGAQDDHGGAGLGEFRTVLMQQADWNGGGKKNASDHNVYDTLFINE